MSGTDPASVAYSQDYFFAQWNLQNALQAAPSWPPHDGSNETLRDLSDKVLCLKTITAKFGAAYRSFMEHNPTMLDAVPLPKEINDWVTEFAAHPDLYDPMSPTFNVSYLTSHRTVPGGPEVTSSNEIVEKKSGMLKRKTGHTPPADAGPAKRTKLGGSPIDDEEEDEESDEEDEKEEYTGEPTDDEVEAAVPREWKSKRGSGKNRLFIIPCDKCALKKKACIVRPDAKRQSACLPCSTRKTRGCNKSLVTKAPKEAETGKAQGGGSKARDKGKGTKKGDKPGKGKAKGGNSVRKAEDIKPFDLREDPTTSRTRYHETDLRDERVRESPSNTHIDNASDRSEYAGPSRPRQTSHELRNEAVPDAMLNMHIQAVGGLGVRVNSVEKALKMQFDDVERAERELQDLTQQVEKHKGRHDRLEGRVARLEGIRGSAEPTNMDDSCLQLRGEHRAEKADNVTADDATTLAVRLAEVESRLESVMTFFEPVAEETDDGSGEHGEGIPDPSHQLPGGPHDNINLTLRLDQLSARVEEVFDMVQVLQARSPRQGSVVGEDDVNGPEILGRQLATLDTTVDDILHRLESLPGLESDATERAVILDFVRRRLNDVSEQLNALEASTSERLGLLEPELTSLKDTVRKNISHFKSDLASHQDIADVRIGKLESRFEEQSNIINRLLNRIESLEGRRGSETNSEIEEETEAEGGAEQIAGAETDAARKADAAAGAEPKGEKGAQSSAAAEAEARGIADADAHARAKVDAAASEADAGAEAGAKEKAEKEAESPTDPEAEANNLPTADADPQAGAEEKTVATADADAAKRKEDADAEAEAEAEAGAGAGAEEEAQSLAETKPEAKVANQKAHAGAMGPDAVGEDAVGEVAVGEVAVGEVAVGEVAVDAESAAEEQEKHQTASSPLTVPSDDDEEQPPPPAPKPAPTERKLPPRKCTYRR
ncbi:hypothetical protein DFP72DRAFT_1063541 [Ephemerocybe angulata]|uniref:Uncharacterized protein n=1 Tax=Ephemerocybe angulata TaxID=980116 RepID=A0A8H6I8L4_9AGAR|nr:hypothetical protein DFP72DRAFT_1063541 [Tulosesus angulatus]